MVIDQKVANRWVARFIPLILIGIVSYTSFVVVGPVCGQLHSSGLRNSFGLWKVADSWVI